MLQSAEERELGLKQVLGKTDADWSAMRHEHSKLTDQAGGPRSFLRRRLLRGRWGMGDKEG